jgi:YHS domain-containing protein
MKKTLILAAMAIVAAAPTFAKEAKPAAKAAPKDLHCAVMATNKVDIAKATKTKMYADHKGRRYFFCCAGCPEAFAKEPAKFAKADSIPTPKKK